MRQRSGGGLVGKPKVAKLTDGIAARNTEVESAFGEVCKGHIYIGTIGIDKATRHPIGAANVFVQCAVLPLSLVIQAKIGAGGGVAEVSKMTGSPEAVVKVRAFRARRKLRKELERLERTK